MSKSLPSVLLKASVLLVFWFLLTGLTDASYTVVGALACLIISWLSTPPKSRTEPDPDLGSLILTAFRAVRYAFWLFYKILLAAIHVSLVVFSPRMRIEPVLFKINTKLRSDTEKTIFANSITLTPGTITADIEGDVMTIHRLDLPSSGDIDSGEMENEVAKIFKEK